MPSKKISIIVPCFNEGEIVQAMLERSQEILASKFGKSYEIIVVNDGSTDNTFEYLHKVQKNNDHIKIISYKKNKGKGHAIKVGVAEATGNVVGFIDSDLDIPPQLINVYYDKLKETKTDIVIGSKWHKKSIACRSLKHQILSRVFNKITEVLFQLKGIDTQVGLKLFRKEVAQNVLSKVKTRGFAFDIEFLVLARKKGFKIFSAPVFINQKGKNQISNIKMRNLIRTFLDIMKLHRKMKNKISSHSLIFRSLRTFLVTLLFIPMEFIFETLVDAT